MYIGESTRGHSLHASLLFFYQVGTKTDTPEPPPTIPNELEINADRPSLRRRRRSIPFVRRAYRAYQPCLRLGHVDLTYRSRNQVLQRQYEKEQELGHITSQSKFNYAWALVKSPNKEQQVEGIGLLQGMLPAYSSSNRRSNSDLILGVRFVP